MVYYHDFKNDQFLNECYFKDKRGGYFVEIGACDGISSSCCYFFENERDWQGIAVEPAKCFHTQIVANRKCIIETSAVTDKTKARQDEGYAFFESAMPVLSGIGANLLTAKKGQVWEQIQYRNYLVPTITLYDMLVKHNAPNRIDYCAIDAEGSEMPILYQFFKQQRDADCPYKISVFSVEIDNNYREINELFTTNDYVEIFNPYLKDMRFDGREITWERYFAHKSFV